jgi:hypothetical protein
MVTMATRRTMDSLSVDLLRPQLKEAQQVLAQAIDAACGIDLEEIDTGELIRIEESLALANKAAKHAVSLRLVRRRQRALGKQGVAAGSSSDATQVVAPRVFDDFHGNRWHAFAVYPSQATTDRAALPESYREGWLAFRSERELRRVAPAPPNWNDLSIDELRELCHKAEAAPKRP